MSKQIRLKDQTLKIGRCEQCRFAFYYEDDDPSCNITYDYILDDSKIMDTCPLEEVQNET